MKTQPVYVGTSPSDVDWNVHDGDWKKVKAQREKLLALWAKVSAEELNRLQKSAPRYSLLAHAVAEEVARRQNLAREVK